MEEQSFCRHGARLLGLRASTIHGRQAGLRDVFQDGKNYANEEGQFRVPIVFDNLIAQGEMPVTIGIFINPGAFPAKTADGKPESNPQL